MHPHESGDDSATQSPTTRLDERLRLLADHDRRRAVAVLADTDGGRLPTRLLAERLAADLDREADRETVLLELHHVHLPKLDHAGLVEYEEGGSLVTYRGDPLTDDCLRAIEGLEVE